MNVVVYVSDALRADHLGCYGARFLNTRTIDELAAGGIRFDQAISAAPWTAPAMTSMVTGLYAAPPRLPALGRRARSDDRDALSRVLGATATRSGTFVFDTNYLFKEMPEANVLGTSETLDGAIAWLREKRDKPFLLFFHNWATHMPYDILHSERKDWLAAKQEVIGGIQADSASALEATREGYRQGGRAPVGDARRVDARGAREPRPAREARCSRSSPTTGSPGASASPDKQDVQGVYHMHGAALYDEIVNVPLILSAPGRLDPAVVATQVRSVDLMPTLLELAGLPAREIDGESLLSARGRPPGGDRRHGQGRADEARRPHAAVEADPRRGERGGGGLQPRTSTRGSSRAVPPTRPPSSGSSSSASSRAPSGASSPRRRRRPSRGGSPTSATSSHGRARRALRADVLHPPLRGVAPRPLRAGEARRHDPHLHRPGGERGRDHRPPRARARRRSSRTTAATGTTSRSRTTRSACSAR